MNNFPASSKLSGMGNGQAIAVGVNWRRANYLLAGYGYVLPATVSDPVVADLVPSSELKTKVVLSSGGD